MNWTTQKPTKAGQYKIRALPHEKLVVGGEVIKEEREVKIAFIRDKENKGLCVILGASVFEVDGTGLEFLGPLEPMA